MRILPSHHTVWFKVQVVIKIEGCHSERWRRHGILDEKVIAVVGKKAGRGEQSDQ